MNIATLGNMAITPVLKILTLKISKQGKMTIIVIATWLDDAKPIILS